MIFSDYSFTLFHLTRAGNVASDADPQVIKLIATFPPSCKIRVAESVDEFYNVIGGNAPDIPRLGKAALKKILLLMLISRFIVFLTTCMSVCVTCSRIVFV